MSSGHCPRPGYLLCLNNASTRMHLSLFPIHYLYAGRYIIVSMSSETCVMKLSLIFAIPKLGCTIYNSFHLNFPRVAFPPSPGGGAGPSNAGDDPGQSRLPGHPSSFPGPVSSGTSSSILSSRTKDVLTRFSALPIYQTLFN